MPYIFIENNEVISITDYEVEIPSTVEKVEISQSDYEGLLNGTHIVDMPTKTIVQNTAAEKERQNNANLSFLHNTDWKVLRHLREKTLGVTTSLSEQEFLELEESRQKAAKSIDNTR